MEFPGELAGHRSCAARRVGYEQRIRIEPRHLISPGLDCEAVLHDLTRFQVDLDEGVVLTAIDVERDQATIIGWGETFLRRGSPLDGVGLRYCLVVGIEVEHGPPGAFRASVRL